MRNGTNLLALAASMVVVPAVLFAQMEDGIPNPDFEAWAGGDPVGWWTTDQDLPVNTVYETSDAQHGVLAMCGEVVDFFGAPIPPVALAGPSERGFSYDKRPRTLRGWFQWFPLGGDALHIDVALRRGDDPVGGGGIVLTEATSDSGDYQDFLVQLNYFNELVPDTATILISISSNAPPNPPAVGSKYIVDNLWFGGFELHTQKDIFAPEAAISQYMTDLGGTAEGADDFTVPVDEVWTINSVIACGFFSEGAGENYESTTINFIEDDGGRPSDNIVATRTVFVPAGTQGAPQDFHFFWPYDNAVVLDPGTYWLNVVVEMPVELPDSLFWLWLARTEQIGNPFHWRDTLDILEYGLTDWVPGGANGIAGGYPDLLFELVGFVNLSTDVDDEAADGSLIPEAFELRQNYPNPFNPSTTFMFGLPRASDVQLIVYDPLGQEVARVLDESFGAGHHTVTWDPRSLSSGVYFYRLFVGDLIETRKLVLLK